MHPALEGLVAQYLATAHLARKPSTRKEHVSEWDKFTTWVRALDDRLNPLQLDPLLVAMYLTKVRMESAEAGIGYGRVMKASAAISTTFELLGKQSPTAHPACVTVRQVAERTLFGKKLHRDELEAADLKALVTAFGHDGATLMDLMHITAVVLMFTGFMRYDDMTKVLVHEDLLRVADDRLELFLYESKTDALCHGAWVVVSALPGSICCPVTLVRRLLAMGGYVTVPPDGHTDLGPLLRPVLKVKAGHKLKAVTASLAHPIKSTGASRLRERLQEMCSQVGIHKSIGLHSCRIGGATEAARHRVPDRLFQKHGRWRSAEVSRRYVRESLDQQLLVTRNLGL